jgi:hypothetical protein
VGFDHGRLNGGLVEHVNELLHLGDGMSQRFYQLWARFENRPEVFRQWRRILPNVTAMKVAELQSTLEGTSQHHHAYGMFRGSPNHIKLLSIWNVSLRHKENGRGT